ncbi:MAG TPA: PilZ domain-containing protein [Terriglobales bacterium]|nr:PilZ domain-containing protein [Terriglobales bacterium]
MGQPQEVVPGEVHVPERRKHPRYMCSLPVEIRQPGVSFPSQGCTSDISLGGCYVSSRFNLAVGMTVELKLWVRDLGIKTHAIVRTSDPGVGNGLEFTDLTADDEKTLGEYLAKLDAAAPLASEQSNRDLLIF